VRGGVCHTSAACAPCNLATYKPALGNATCAACPANTNTTAVAHVALAECLCAPGFFFRKFIPQTVTTFVNVAPGCGVNQDAACPASASSSGVDASRGINDNLQSLFYTHESTSARHWFRVDLQAARDIVHIVFYNRNDCCRDRANGGHIRVGSSPTWEENAVCATLDASAIQTRACEASGQYVFIVLPMGRATLNFAQFRVFSAIIVVIPGQIIDDCPPCAAGSFKGHVGNEACAPCPVDTFCPVQSVAPVPCVGNSSRLEVGGATQFDCLCRPGVFTEDALSRTCRACPVGTFNALFDQSDCTACPAGTVNTRQASDDAAACIACGANAAAPAGSSDAVACACNVGFAGEPGGVCVACAAGKFRSNLSEYICQECPANTYNAELSVVSIESCLACPANTSTTNRTGSGSQLDCVCRPGFRTDAEDASKRQCAECGPGRFHITPPFAPNVQRAPTLRPPLPCPQPPVSGALPAPSPPV